MCRISVRVVSRLLDDRGVDSAGSSSICCLVRRGKAIAAVSAPRAATTTITQNAAWKAPASAGSRTVESAAPAISPTSETRTVETTATPTAPPISRMVSRRPDARPVVDCVTPGNAPICTAGAHIPPRAARASVTLSIWRPSCIKSAVLNVARKVDQVQSDLPPHHGLEQQYGQCGRRFMRTWPESASSAASRRPRRRPWPCVTALGTELALHANGGGSSWARSVRASQASYSSSLHPLSTVRMRKTSGDINV